LTSDTSFLFSDCLNQDKFRATLLPIIDLHISTPNCDVIVSLRPITFCKMFHTNMNVVGLTEAHISLVYVSFNPSSVPQGLQIEFLYLILNTSNVI
jgi:hypothetical protein